jgi:hypothetical protein
MHLSLKERALNLGREGAGWRVTGRWDWSPMTSSEDPYSLQEKASINGGSLRSCYVFLFNNVEELNVLTKASGIGYCVSRSVEVSSTSCGVFILSCGLL